MATASLCFAVIPLVFLSVFPSIAKCGLIGDRNISCLVCHHNSDHENPESPHACLDRDDVSPSPDDLKPSKLLERRMVIMDRCSLCSIEDTWDLSTKKYDGDRRKRCIVTNTIGVGCNYHHPVGQDDKVIEICRCDTDLCNLRGIDSIGGKDDVNQFPKREVIIQESNSSNRNFTPNFVIVIIIVTVFFKDLII